MSATRYSRLFRAHVERRADSCRDRVKIDCSVSGRADGLGHAEVDDLDHRLVVDDA